VLPGREKGRTLKYPEHEKLAKVKDESQIIGTFLDNLPDDTVLAIQVSPGRFLPYRGRIEEILADYFDIDLDKIETEKLQMLEELRKQ